MSPSTGWRPIDLADQRAREQAVTFARQVMKSSGEIHLRHDLDWALCGEQTLGRVLAFGLDDGGGRTGFGLLLRQDRPLQFQLGEFTYYRKPLIRFDLWSTPLIAGVPPVNDSMWSELAIGFLEAARQHLGTSGEAIGIEALSTTSRFHQILSHDAAIAERFLLIRQGEPFDHQFIEMPETLDRYLEGLGSRSRKSLSYSHRRLNREYADQVELRRVARVDDIPRFLEEAIQISRTTYQWQLLGLGLRDRDGLETRLRFAAAKGWLRSYLLYCAGRPVAFMLAYQHESRFYYTDVGYDPDYGRWSVGSVLQLMVMEALYAEDDRPSVFDFSTGDGEHKARFGNAARQEVNLLLLPRTLRHAILAGAYCRLDTLAQLATATADWIGVKRPLKKALRRLSTAKAAGQTS